MIAALDKLDKQIFFFFNGTISNSVFDFLMPIITNQDIWIIPMIIVWLGLIIRGGKRGKIAAVVLILAIITTDVIAAQVIKPFIGRLRPSRSMPELINLLVGRGGKYGFVSNHAANMFALATIIGYFYNRWRTPLFILATIVAFSRIYVGVHYPGDVLISALFGYTIAWIWLTFWVLLKMRELKRGRTWVWYAGPTEKINLPN